MNGLIKDILSKRNYIEYGHTTTNQYLYHQPKGTKTQ